MIKDSINQIRAILNSIEAELNTLYVKKGDNLQAVIDSAPSNSIIKVYPDTYDALRITKNNITIMPDTQLDDKRVGTDWTNLITVKSNYIGDSVNDCYLVGINFLPSSKDRAIINLGSDVAQAPTNVPNNITFDRCIISADDNVGGKRGIAANCRNLTVVRSHLDNFWYEQDSQAICGWNGPGPFQIVDSFLCASGECVLFGGADSVNESMQPSRLFLKNNLLSKKVEWQTKANTTVKNVFELKNLINAIIIDNTFENCWTDGQSGFLIQFTPRNQGGKAPYSQVAEISFSHNILRNSGAGINVLGRDNNYPSQVATNISILDNLMHNIDKNVYPGAARLVQVVDGPINLTIKANTFLGRNLNSFLSLSGQKSEKLIFSNNIVSEGSYGIAGTSAVPGRTSFDTYTNNGILENNLITDGNVNRRIDYGPTNIRVVGKTVFDADMNLLPEYVNLNVGSSIHAR